MRYIEKFNQKRKKNLQIAEKFRIFISLPPFSGKLEIAEKKLIPYASAIERFYCTYFHLTGGKKTEKFQVSHMILLLYATVERYNFILKLLTTQTNLTGYIVA